MNNVLLYLGGLLVVVLGALFAVPAFIDWNSYRGVFEEEASKVLGRDVRVGGGVNLRLLPIPYVRFEKVRLADVTGQTGEPFVRADSFTMWLSGPALLRGVLEASEVELTKPVLSLALDGQGGGNWSSIELRSGDLPFVPRDVALRSVKLKDGAIAIYNANAQPVARADAINGELSADALRGPFKFKGSADWSGAKRDVKFATTVPDADGSFRIKVATRSEGSQASYVIDAKVEDVSGKPRLSGELTGKLPLPASPAAANAPAAGAGKAASSGEDAAALAIELKSALAADATGALLSDVTLAVEGGAEPQMMTGSAKAAWSGEPRMDVMLASKWLDLDRLAGAGQGSAPFSRIAQLGLSAMRGIAGTGAGTAKIDVEQVKVGGEQAGGLRIDAASAGGVLRLNEVKAALPGGSRVDVTGEVREESGKVSCSGSGALQGASLARLTAWAEKSGAPVDIHADGPFLAQGKLSVSSTGFELTDASGSLGGRPISGAVKVRDDGRQHMDISIETTSLDTAEFFPGVAASLERVLSRTLGLSAADAPGPAAANPPPAPASDTTVRILAAELKHHGQVYRTVDLIAGLDGDQIRLPRARWVTAAGLALSLEGNFKTSNGAAKGNVSYDIVGTSPEALADLVRLSGLTNVIAPERLTAMGSAKLAGLAKFANRTANSADITFDGLVGAAHVAGAAEFDAGFSAWRQAPARVQISADAPKLTALTSVFGLAPQAFRSGAEEPASAVLTAAGVFANRASAYAELKSPGANLVYTGAVSLPDGGRANASGQLSARARELGQVLAVFGVPLAGAAAPQSVAGSADVTYDAGTWTLASRGVSLGPTTLSGTAKIEPAAPSGVKVSGQLAADRITVAGLLAAITDAPRAKPAEAAEAADGDEAAANRSVWPEGSFNFSPLSGLSGDVQLAFKTLELSSGFAARDGSVRLMLGSDRAALQDLNAKAAGGTLKAVATAVRAPDGVTVSLSGKLDGADISALGKPAQGLASLDFNASGRGQTPAGVIALLTGSGTATLTDAVLPGPAPATASTVAAAVLDGKVANELEPVAEALRTALAASAFPAGSRKLGIAVKDGTARIDTITEEGAAGRIVQTTSADLMSLGYNSAWLATATVAPLPPPQQPIPGYTPAPPKGPLPPVRIVYNGRLDAAAPAKPEIDAADMQRELTVRQMERNVEELERLRKMDEERARAERERRKALEAERAAAIAAAKALKAREAAEPAQGAAPGATPSPAASQVPGSTQGQAQGQVEGQGQAAPAVDGAAPASPQTPAVTQSPAASDGGATDAGAVRQQKITIEPIEPPLAQSADPPAPVKPAATAPAPRPQPAVRPPRPPRTSGEEVLRQLGATP